VAKLDTRQIEMGLAGDEREALKGQVFLRDAFGGELRWERTICHVVVLK
jgi:hypothetical protein